MINRYPIKCKYCGETVPARQGECWSVKKRDRYGRERKFWLGCHLECQEKKLGRIGGRKKRNTLQWGSIDPATGVVRYCGPIAA